MSFGVTGCHRRAIYRGRHGGLDVCYTSRINSIFRGYWVRMARTGTCVVWSESGSERDEGLTGARAEAKSCRDGRVSCARDGVVCSCARAAVPSTAPSLTFRRKRLQPLNRLLHPGDRS